MAALAAATDVLTLYVASKVALVSVWRLPLFVAALSAIAIGLLARGGSASTPRRVGLALAGLVLVFVTMLVWGGGIVYLRDTLIGLD